jgi:hypothetical protein
MEVQENLDVRDVTKPNGNRDMGFVHGNLE